MADKKYQVFISSTYSDLIEERKIVLSTLLMADCIPAGMEAFVATNLEQFEVIKKVIDLCDYYILIIGKRYGSIHPETGISYTEMEYDYAISKGIPVLAFILDESVKVSDEKTEKDQVKEEKLAQFRAKATDNRLVSMWSSMEDLSGKLAVSIMKAKIEIARPGWQRGTDYDEASLRREIMNAQETIKGLREELNGAKKALDDMTRQTDIAFEDCEIEIKYTYKDFHHTTRTGQKKTSLVEIFKVIATEMMDVDITEFVIDNAIKKQLLPTSDYSYSLTDSQFIKRILNQYKSLNLINSYWSKENKKQYWRLTAKGKKTRDDLILIRKK